MALTLKIVCFAIVLIFSAPVENFTISQREPKQESIIQSQSTRGSFYRGAVESASVAGVFGRQPLRDAVEYRPIPDYHPTPIRLKVFSQPLFLSHFAVPTLHVDYFRRNYPEIHHSRLSLPHPQPKALLSNFVQPNYYIREEVSELCTNGQGVRPHPNNCAGYLICLHEKWSFQTCVNGLHFNAQLGICDWPANAGCSSSSEVSSLKPPVVVEENRSTIIVESTTKTPVNPPSSEKGGKKVICYYTNWSWYRIGEAKFTPSEIDLDLCSHIIYGFATLDPSRLIMQVFDSWSDTDEYGPSLYRKVTALKSNGIKVLIALGGWNDSQGDKYSRLVNNPTARQKFIENAMIFIEQYGFDGLDLDWEYPKCWQVDCDKGPASDKMAFVTLIKELRTAFNPKGWLLTAAVSPSKVVIDVAYDVPSISRYLDWIGVMTYDYHGHWDNKTGHVAPLQFHSESDKAYFNAEYSLKYWIQLGADPLKLIMGIPLYGQSFTLTDANNHGLNAPSTGTGEAGEFTRQGGFLAYYEICTSLKSDGWTVVQDPQRTIGPYAYRDRQWISFDDIEMIHKKSEMVKNLALGGAMVWALDLDDFRNKCGCETYPLLKTINRVLRNYPATTAKCEMKSASPLISYDPVENSLQPFPKTSCKENSFKSHESNCGTYYHCVFGEWSSHQCPDGLHWNKDHCDWPATALCGESSIVEAEQISPEQPNQWKLETTTTTTSTTTFATTMTPQTSPAPNVNVQLPFIALPDTGYKVICYFTNWAIYRPGTGKFGAEDIDPSLCSHIIYGFATLNGWESTMQVFDSWADTDEYGHKLYAKVTALRSKGIKVLIGLGGWNDSLGSKYSVLVNNPSARKKFVRAAVQFIEKYGFDGLDLDWEYPKCWQVDCKAGPESDKPAFTEWVKELSAELKPRGWLLSAAVSPSKTVIDLGYEVAELSKYFDWIGVMTYDYFGNWDKETGHLAPLYAHSQIEKAFFNTNFTLNYWMQLGADRKKIIMGLPMYGQSFTLADPSNHSLNAKASGPGEAGEFTRQGGFLSFYEICSKIRQGGWTVEQDPEGAIGPYAYKGNQWTSFDDVPMIRKKSQLIKTMDIGGAMIWALDLDDFRNSCGCEPHPLLRTINRVLRDYPGPDPNCDYHKQN